VNARAQFAGMALGSRQERPRLGHNLTFGLLHAIGGAIAAGDYDDRPFPAEAELAEQYGTSLSVTREAVKMLTAKGLLASRPRQGTRVRPVACWSLLDTDVLRWLLQRRHAADVLGQFDQLRIAIEPAAAELAARFAWPRGVRRISDCLEEIALCERHQEDPIEPQIAFHAAILQASRNPFYAQFQDAVGTALRIANRMRRRAGDPALELAAYAAVCEAISGGDWERAREAMHGIVSGVFPLSGTTGQSESITEIDENAPDFRLT
jgi:DNA-binding FadR family transcriptional regulator